MLRLNPYTWKIPKGFREAMRVPAQIIAKKSPLHETLHDS